MSSKFESIREEPPMSLFDVIKDKATELLSGASDKVTELTDVELPGGEIVDKATDAVDPRERG
jgi:hypothetical protein